MRTRLIFIAMLCSLSPLQAQTHGGHHTHGPAQPNGGLLSPYAGMQQRQIKAFSEEQIGDLRAGRGMSLALAAELNNYPGPMHVLEFADKLELTVVQRQTMETLINKMRNDAAEAGEALIAAERELDMLFAKGQANDVSLATHMQKISQAQGQVRLIHLRTHMPTRAALTSEQITHYARLRGYISR
jgi:hypothetical protein